MENVTYEEYEKAVCIVYKYLESKYGGYIDMDMVLKENAEINLLSAITHPYLYIKEKIK